MEKKEFILTKKIAKHGKQSILVIPRMLEQELKPRTMVKVTIEILREVENPEGAA
jgi:hypothetical protein